MKYVRTLNTILVFILIYVLFTFSTPVAAAGVTVGVSSVAMVDQGDDFTANITIADVTDFDAAQYDITYNPTVIQVTYVTSGNISGTKIPVDMWASINSTTIRVINNVTNATGVSGSGYLAEIHFHVVGTAGTSSAISLSNGILGDKDAQQIPATWTDGSVQVSGSSSQTGGGGGGGGGSTGITSLAEYMTGDGLIVISATAESADGIVKLDLPKGTTVKNRSGQRLYSISIKPSSTPTVPPDGFQFVCLTYDIGPSGATFNPPIHLTFKYSDLQVTTGVTEESLVIATWQDDKWITLEGCIVDKVKNTVTVPISHFTFFNVIAHTAIAHFEISGMSINPDEVYPDESVTVKVTITNTGGLTGSYDVTLKMNNLALQTQKVTLGGGESQMISFTVIPDKSGEYTIDVNGLSSSIKVKEPVPEGTVAEVAVPVSPSPTSFTISDLSITPVEINPSEEVTISSLVTNIGGSDGSYSVVLKIDDKEETRKGISLTPGQSERISFSVAKDMVGSHTIDINGHAGQFTVKSPPPSLKPDRTLPLKPSTNGWAIIGIFIGSCCIIGISISLLKRLSWPN